MEAFTVTLTGIGADVSQAITNLLPMFTFAAGLAIAAGVLGWGLNMIKRWRR
jgi:hypothetical protein